MYSSLLLFVIYFFYFVCFVGLLVSKGKSCNCYVAVIVVVNDCGNGVASEICIMLML